MLICSLTDYATNKKEKAILLKEVKERYEYIWESYFDLLELNDDDFDMYDVEELFPPRYFREHTKKELINTLLEVKDILYSDVIRYELKPIYVFIIYHLINICYEYIEEINENEGTDDYFPKTIKSMLEHSHISEEGKEIIEYWFKESDLILDEFCDNYDGDFIDVSLMESLAYLFIYCPERYNMLGANIVDALDLIPKDLADLCLEAKNIRMKNNEQKFDFFISYASEEKEDAVLLSQELEKQGATVWIDDQQLKIGDQIRTSLEKGLINSRYGIVLVSKNYLNKYWTNQELNCLYELEEYGKKKILPILLNVSHDEIKSKSVFLANKLGINYNRDNIEKIVKKIIDDCMLEQ